MARILGAPQDIQAGIYMHKKNGENVDSGDVLMTLYANSQNKFKEALDTLETFPIY